MLPITNLMLPAVLAATQSGWVATEEAFLVAHDPADSATYGISVDLEEDSAFVAAYKDLHPTGVETGAVHPFERTGTTWVEGDRVFASDVQRQLFFGSSLAVSGDTLVVGALGYDNAGQADAGAAYVFTHNALGWTERARLLPSLSAPMDYFGSSVAIFGDTIVVGAPNNDHDPTLDEAGSAFVFVRTGNSWTEQAVLRARNPQTRDFFGTSVSIWGDTVVVGAPFKNSMGATLVGAVYVFVRSGSEWTEKAAIRPPSPMSSDHFGGSVSVWDDTLAVGAQGVDHAGIDDAGAAYLYERSGTQWSLDTMLTAHDFSDRSEFGEAISLVGDRLAVGAFDNTHSCTPFPGASYAFARTAGTWVEQAKLTASVPGSNDQFGVKVAVWGDTVFSTAPFDDFAGLTWAGSATVHRITPGTSPNYCTPGTSAGGCQAWISATGVPSATAPSGSWLNAVGVEASSDGVFFYGTQGRQTNPWGNGSSSQCVVPPVRRTGSMSGSGVPGTCEGTFCVDLNSLWSDKPQLDPGAGAVVQAQLWYRDPLNTSNQTTSLSDAVEFTVGP